MIADVSRSTKDLELLCPCSAHARSCTRVAETATKKASSARRAKLGGSAVLGPRYTKALNAHFMGCDAFEEGDLLVTFPGCKAPQLQLRNSPQPHHRRKAIRFLQVETFAVGSLESNISNIFTHKFVDSLHAASCSFPRCPFCWLGTS